MNNYLRRAPTLLYRTRLNFLLDRTPTLASNGLLLLSGVITSTAISRLLGPADRGQYVTWQSWASAIAVAAVVGLPQVVVIEKWSERRHRLGELIAPLAVTVVAGAAIALALGMLFLNAHAAWVGMLLVVASTQFGAVATAEAQRVGRMKGEFNVVRLLPIGAALVAIGALWLSESRSPATWLTVIAASQLSVVICGLLFVTRPFRLQPRDPNAWKKTLMTSARLAPGAWVTLLQYRADVLAVSVIFSQDVVGYYAVGLAAQATVAAIGQVGGQYWFSQSRTKDGAARPSLRRELVRTAAVALSVMALVVGLAGWWLPSLYGEAFRPAFPLVVGLCLTATVQSIDYLLSHELLLVSLGERVALYRLPAVLFMVLAFVAISMLGIGSLGAVVVATLGYVISGAIMGVALWKQRRTSSLIAKVANEECHPTGRQPMDSDATR